MKMISTILAKLKEYLALGLALIVGWFLVVFQLRGRKIARLEAKELVSDENAKQKALDEAVKKAKEEYEETD